MSGPTVLPHPAREELSLTAVLAALSDPERLAIVCRLDEGALDMAECFSTSPDMPKSTRSHLMKVLREAGIVQNDPAPHGPGRRVSLRRDDLQARFPGLLPAVLENA
ncbi:ArsR/SmtB family transcription factor [Microbacterium caowuchunii]|uniref:ArsR family transcriptional regulator n=1 Tax=Microbacterium caowuchunii TaxID=2614638 RepID=A0A5N0TKG7_9MICO|nr:ArsR family transcriptional regulator [Microbacterium caowuchunii]KAA9134426.1 ArsR family transcriptional regulator [Microbacterium caowuchunii]